MLTLGGTPASGEGSRPGFYTAAAGAQGLGYFVTFPGSLVKPLLSGSIPYAIANTDWTSGSSGTATVAHPGALPLVYQDAALLVAPQAAPVQPLFPKYPFIVNGGKENRKPAVGAPGVTFPGGGGQASFPHMACELPDDDSAAVCSAEASSFTLQAPAAFAPAGTPESVAGERIRLWSTWRTRLEGMFGSWPDTGRGPARPAQEENVLVSVQSLKAKAATSVDEKGSQAGADLAMQGVALLGGALRFDLVTQHYEAASEKGAGRASGTTRIVGASLGGVPVTIGPDGVKVSDAVAADKKQIEGLNQQLADNMARAGLQIRVAQERNTSAGSIGGIAGDGVYVEATIGSGVDSIVTAFWLGSGRAEADASAPVEPAVNPWEGTPSAGGLNSGGAGSEEAATATAESRSPPVLEAAGSGVNLDDWHSGRAPTPPAAFSSAAGPEAPAIALSPVRPEGTSMHEVSSSRAGRALTTGGLSRNGAVAFLALCQALGLATLTAYGLRAHHSRTSS